MSKEKSNDKDIKRKIKNKYTLNDSLKEKLLEWPEVLAYIEMLQKHIEKLTKKLNKWKIKVKDCKNVSTQTGSGNEIEKTDKTKSFLADIQEAAEMVTKNSGFVYEETSGMYYDYNTGYYYNAEFGLYYDGNLGNYLKYNQDTHSYEFHSHVGPPTTSTDGTKTKRTLHSDKRKHKKRRSSTESKDVEEGECSSSSSTEESEKDTDDNRHYPPCMRIIIDSTGVTNLKTGSLHIITCSGGSIGREGEHSILISDINISKYHLQINYNQETCKYYGIDMGSRNGTLLNGKRMSPSKQESEPMEIVHGSRLQIGSTTLVCHIHDGNQTCGHCEPGLIQTKEIENNMTSTKEIHKMELKNLKKKFGINSYEEDNTKLASGYKDRAEQRRQVIGSQNPHEKTETASIDESIKSDNKGFKMLQKLGWKEGDSLGKEGKGLLEPIKIVPNEVVENTKMNLKDDKRGNIWMKTQDRYQKLPNSIILDDDENC